VVVAGGRAEQIELPPTVNSGGGAFSALLGQSFAQMGQDAAGNEGRGLR